MATLICFTWCSLHAAITNRDSPPVRELGIGRPPNNDPARATVLCLTRLVEASGRTDIDVLKNGDLAIHGPKGLRIEKSNGRHTTLDPVGNCAVTSMAGKLFDRDAYNSILVSAYARLANKDEVDRLCGQADKQILKDLVKRAAGVPLGYPSPVGR